MKGRATKSKFAVCVNNREYPAALELHKIYQVVADAGAAKHKLIRVIDESGEDYLYPADCFVPIALPPAVQQAFSARTARPGA